jgi:[acyl-carrier-protein] S-malonyltransferase
MSTVFLFPGQGAQFPGMVKDICQAIPEAMKVVTDAEQVSGEPLFKWLWDIEAQELARSDRSQLSITVASLAVSMALQTRGIKPSVCAGFSLGEFAALYTAGILSFEDTIQVVKQRGLIMQKACELIKEASKGADGEEKAPGMCAVIGLTPEQVVEALAPYSGSDGIAFPVNMNSPKQTVVSGTSEGLELCEKICKEKGARRVIRLQVAGPFHSPLMKKASQEFEQVLNTVAFKDPELTLLSNVTGKKITIGEEAKQLAVKHFTHPVLWTAEEKEINTILQQGTDNLLIEAGPGTVLTGLWRDSGYADTISCVSCGTLEQLNLIKQ